MGIPQEHQEKMESILSQITDTLNLPDKDNDLNREKKLPLDEFRKKETKKEEESPESDGQENDKPQGDDNGIKDIEAAIDDLGLEGKDKEEYLSEVQERLKKGESVETITKEIADAKAELSADDKKEEGKEDKDEDDLIPKSKYEKVVKKMESRIDQLTAKLKSYEDKMEQKPDNDKAKLESMSSEELRHLKREVSLMLIEGKNEKGDVLSRDEKLKLIGLQDEISELSNTAPQRFFKKQMLHLEKVIPDIQEVYPDILEQIKSGKGELVEVAKNIYSKTKSFQSSELGWVEAFNLAMTYTQESKTGDDKREKENVSSLKRRLNELKRKTTLSGKQSVANAESTDRKKTYQKAVNGDSYDKIDYIHKFLVKNVGF